MIALVKIEILNVYELIEILIFQRSLTEILNILINGELLFSFNPVTYKKCVLVSMLFSSNEFLQ